MLTRYLEKNITEDVRKKMVFISGPRQVGKTTLSKQIGKRAFSGDYAYLNWDNRDDRAVIMKGLSHAEKKLVIFDEVHKYRNWKNYLKGEYDKYKEQNNILVTGSARLDVYRKGGDSLLGRYHSYRLHPLSLHEVLSRESHLRPFEALVFGEDSKIAQETLGKLLRFGGFPEIFTQQDERGLRRWHNEKIDRLIKEDIRDIESVRDLSALQLLVELLPDKVGSLFSVNSLREDLETTHKTVSLWVDIFERFFYHFRIYPYQSTLIKTLRKEPKLYLWDWSEVKDESLRFENMIASHLLKFCHYFFDVEGYKAQLHYLRDKQQREVDFLVTVGHKPWFCVEVKRTFKEIPASLKYFSSRLKVPFVYQVVFENGVDIYKDAIRIISASKFLSGLV